MDGSHVTNTDFRYGGASRLMDYVERKEDYELENRAGEKMSEKEKEVFRKKSDYYGFERQYILSPREKDQYSERDLAEATRDSINEYFDGESVDYCYSVHADEGHSHVILTGEKDDLYMNKSDMREFNKQSKKQFKKREKSLEKQLLRENGLEKEKERKEERTRQPRWMQFNGSETS